MPGSGVTYYVGGILTVALLIMLWQLTKSSDGGITFAQPTMPAIHDELATPLNVTVHAVLEMPTEPPPPTLGAFGLPTVTSTPGGDYCNPKYQQGGTVCRQPYPTPPTPTPYPSCANSGVEAGDVCTWPTSYAGI